MTSSPSSLPERVLVLAPVGKDAALTQSTLQRAGIATHCCRDLREVRTELEAGADVLLVVEETVSDSRSGLLADWLEHQPPWSDLPILVLSRPGANSEAVAHSMDQLGNVTVLERPMRVAALVSAVRTALRSRQRQLQIRDHLADRERSIETQALLAAIVASSDDAIISKSLDGIILTWNSGAERVFGFTAKEAIGRPITLLIPPERLDEETVILERLRRGERIEHFETVRMAKDGRRLDISLTVSPIRDGSGRIFAASKVARDITESKRAAEALRQAKEQLLVVTDNMAAAVTRCSREMRYLWISPGFASWMKRRSEDVVGANVADVLGPAAFDQVQPYIQRVLAGERIEYEMELPYAEIGPVWVHAVYVPTHDHAGQVDGWVAVLTDVTIHRRMEAALRDADRRKDEFLAVLAHELRNPLAPIRNSMHILRMTSRSDDSLGCVVEMLERQVNHMVRLVDDLMEVSRITRGKIELRRERIEIAAVVRSAIETSRPLIDAAGHHLAVLMPQEPLIVDGDVVRLTQVVANLLNNAAKYTDPAGQLQLKVLRDGTCAVISVRDTGTGIPSALLPRIFDMFIQFDRDSGRSQGGLGIGLTIVKNLVELHGGTVEARSEGIGCGSEFSIRLPLVAPTPRAIHDSRQSRADTVLSPRRVLVVDDNRDAADSLATLLKLLGAEVQVVYNGPDALDAFQAHRPFAVIMDIGMPGLDGYEVARRIRETIGAKDVTLIALTGWSQEGDRSRTRAAGFNHHLIKPADVDVLKSLLTSLEHADLCGQLHEMTSAANGSHP